jgi:anthranilate phosphoribosyltransferase
MLTQTAAILRQLAYRQDLTSEESRWLLSTICAEDIITDDQRSDGLYLTALTFGVMAKGPTSDELYGFVLSLAEQSVSLESRVAASQVVDVSGTGGDRIKTFNVGSAVSVVLAAAGAYVAKQATRAYTGFTGSADVFSQLGADVFSQAPEKVVACLEQTGLAVFHTPSLSPKLKNRLSFLTKLANVGLLYPTLWHLVSWIHSPFKMDNRLYGVFDRRYLDPVAETFLKLGYRRVMVVHGADGLDEISNVGETHIAEVADGKISYWTLSPESCGIRRAPIDGIQLCPSNPGPGSRREVQQRALRCFFEVLYGRERGPKRDLVLINAGAAFYLCGKVRSIAEGVEMAAATIDSGATVGKLREFADFWGALTRLGEWESQL